MDWKLTVDQELVAEADRLLGELNTTDWLLGNDQRRKDGRNVKNSGRSPGYPAYV